MKTSSTLDSPRRIRRPASPISHGMVAAALIAGGLYLAVDDPHDPAAPDRTVRHAGHDDEPALTVQLSKGMQETVGFSILVLGCGSRQQESRRGKDWKRTSFTEVKNRAPLTRINGSSELDDNDEMKLLDSFAIVQDDNLVLVPVTLQGKDYLFMLDTGTTFHTFDVSLRHCLGEPIQIAVGKTPGADISVKAFDPPIARIGTLDFDQDSPVICADLTIIRHATGKEIHGILGTPFFQRHIVQIDWDRDIVSVFQTGSRPDTEWGEAFPITFDELDGPVLDASLDGRCPIRFLIDVGATATGTFTDDLFSQLVERSLLELTGNRIVATTGGNVRQFTGRLGEIRVGQFEHENLIFAQGKRNKLGLGYLSRYCVTFDFRKALVYLKKSNGYSRIDHEDMSGLRLMRIEGETIVLSAVEDSPTFLAGIRDGDRIIRINDRPASQYELADIRNLFRSGDGEEVILTSRHGLQEMTTTIRLREKRPKKDTVTQKTNR